MANKKKFEKALKKYKKKKWFMPTLIVAIVLVFLLGIGGIATAQKMVSARSNKFGKTTTSSDVGITTVGNTGTLFKIGDSSEKDYTSNEISESGYDTTKLNTGMADRLRQLQEQLDSFTKSSGINETEYQADIRGKVDYAVLNDSLKSTSDTINNKIHSSETLTASEIETLRQIIASNKSDSESKLNEIKNAGSQNQAAIDALSTQVKTNQSTNEAKLKELQSVVNNTINTNITQINNRLNGMENGTTAVLVGRYDKTTNTFMITGGNSYASDPDTNNFE